MQLRNMVYKLRLLGWHYAPDPEDDYRLPAGLYNVLAAGVVGNRFKLSMGTLSFTERASDTMVKDIRLFTGIAQSWPADSPLDHWQRRMHIVKYWTLGLKLLFEIKCLSSMRVTDLSVRIK